MRQELAETLALFREEWKGLVAAAIVIVPPIVVLALLITWLLP